MKAWLKKHEADQVRHDGARATENAAKGFQPQSAVGFDALTED